MCSQQDDWNDQEVSSQENHLNNLVQSLKSSLLEIVDDLSDRLSDGDHNLISGAKKFIQAYKKLECSDAPNSSLSYALHNFGKSDSKSNFLGNSLLVFFCVRGAGQLTFVA